MARSRNIKPGFFSNDDLADCQPLARLLFIGLWCVADREGRMEDRPRRIRAEILPYDNCDIDTLLDELQQHGFILRYEVGGDRFIQVLNFTKHQNPHMKEAKSTIPARDSEGPEECEPEASTVESQDSPDTDKDQAPEEHQTSTVQEPEQHNESPADCGFLIPDSLIPDSNQTPCAPPAHDAEPSVDLFDRFWNLYPNKKNKANARKAWAKLKVTDHLFDQIVAGLARYCASPDWVKDGGQFIPHPTTWLNGKRWEDEVALPTSNVHKFPGASRHSGFDDRDYTKGLTPRGDGTYDF